MNTFWITSTTFAHIRSFFVWKMSFYIEYSSPLCIKCHLFAWSHKMLDFYFLFPAKVRLILWKWNSHDKKERKNNLTKTRDKTSSSKMSFTYLMSSSVSTIFWRPQEAHTHHSLSRSDRLRNATTASVTRCSGTKIAQFVRNWPKSQSQMPAAHICPRGSVFPKLSKFEVYWLSKL